MRKGKTFRKEVDADVEIDSDDIIEFIEDYASDSELCEIRRSLEHTLGTYSGAISGIFEYTGLEGTLVQDQKLELLNIAFKKYTLLELEERLGRAFDIQ
jgi:hypothetical protein